MKTPEVTVIISTYNQPDWLAYVLYSYEYQKFKDFEVIIADDGSGVETEQLIQKVAATASFPITHVWHEDEGFRKTVILNTAIQQAKATYLLCTDGDCIARADFIATHMRLRTPGYFLSGGYFKLSQEVSSVITKSNIETQACFDVKWLQKQGMPSSFKMNKLTAKGRKASFLNYMTPTKATWDGMNASGWTKDILSVNGFDERMQYGGEDRELGERLFNLGIKAKQIRYSAICLHLFHERSYVSPDMVLKNKAIRKETKKNNSVYSNFGIVKS